MKKTCTIIMLVFSMLLASACQSNVTSPASDISSPGEQASSSGISAEPGSSTSGSGASDGPSSSTEQSSAAPSSSVPSSAGSAGGSSSMPSSHSAVSEPSLLEELEGYAGLGTVTELDGLNQGIVTGRTYKAIMKNPDQYFDQWHNMNLSWIRIEFEESIQGSLPTTRDTYINLIKEAHKRGIKVLGIVSINSISSYKSEFPRTAASVSSYISEVEIRIRDYKVDAIEICNEPWEFVTSKNSTLLHYYAELMIKTYEQLKPKYPGTLFIAPVTSNAEKGEWLGDSPSTLPESSIFNCAAMQAYRDSNAGKLPLDIISWHPYGTGADPVSGNFYFGRNFNTYYSQILAYKDLKGRTIVGDYPIWFTEYGWQDSNYDTQNTKYLNMVKVMKSHPQIKLAFWYTWQDDETNAAGTEYKKYGLIRSSAGSYAKKPVYYSFFSSSSMVGEGSDFISLPVLTRYLEAGGRSVLGRPVTQCTGVTGAKYQSFADSNGKKSAILLENGKSAAFLLAGEFYNAYFQPDGAIRSDRLALYGIPTSAFTATGSQQAYMDTTKGRLVLDGTQISLSR